MSEKKNPCTFKPVCRSCNKVEVGDRPQLCEAMACKDYQPCPGCGMNRTLHDSINKGTLCKICLKTSKIGIQTEIKETAEAISNGASVSTGNMGVKVRGLHSLSIPGVAPDDLEDEEKEYYDKRWAEYHGYYRNPAAYYNCHQLILLEIHSSYLNRSLIGSRGELQKDLSRDLQVTIALRKMVQDQLPDKEAEDVMDDEKSLAMIYDTYRKEKGLRSLGPVSRVFRRDTVAIAPYLEFPLDPRVLLTNCGFKVVEVDKVVERIKDIPLEGKTPEEVLKFFGFELDEKYAMPTNTQDLDDFDPEELFGDESQ